MDLTFDLAYEWALGTLPDVTLAVGEPGSNVVSIFQTIGDNGAAYPRIVLLQVGPDSVVTLDEYSPGAHDGWVGSDYFVPRVSYLNGRWVAMWPHFVDSSDAIVYYLAVWTHSGGSIVMERSEYVTVPYAHTTGTTMYGVVMGVLDDCVILNAGYQIGSTRRFYSRVVPVGSSAATASVSDFELTGTGAGAPLYARDWSPGGSSAIRFHWIVDDDPAGYYLITKGGSVSWVSGTPDGGWYYFNDYTGGAQSLIDGEAHRFTRTTLTDSSWIRMTAAGAVVDSTPGYVDAYGSYQNTIVRFKGRLFATEYAATSGGYPSGFYGVLRADLYGTDPSNHLQSAIPGTSYVTVLNVVATKDHLLLAGTDFSAGKLKLWRIGGVYEVSNLAGELGRGRVAFT